MNEPKNGFRAPLVEEIAPLFPGYQVLSLIAKSGMGAVYHAIQNSLEREVAIKILPVELGDDPGFCESFEAEAKAMARLSHPNLIRVYDFGEVNGMFFIVMEYVPGQSLQEACNGSAIDPGEVIRLMTGISRGLAHAHEHGILHGHIKPANILLDPHLQPRIGNFGLAHSEDAEVYEGETIFGTPGYTAPELLDPPHAGDQRADIFSLGVLLHELLTGLLPTTDLRSASAISSCDPRFDAVVDKATHPSPLQRYQDAAEMADTLQEIANIAEQRVVQTASPAAYRPPVPAGYSNQPTQSGGGKMLVALLLIAGIVAVFFFRNQIFHNTDPSPDPPSVVDHQPEPVKPGPVAAEPEPIKPEPEPAEPEPVLAATEPEPLEPEPGPAAAEPEPAEPEPGPVAADPVQAPQPNCDVEAFLVHARSVMLGRCSSDIAKRDEALEKNLADFQNDAMQSIKENLLEKWHEGGRKELGVFVDKCRADGNRMREGLENPLKHKKFLVTLHDEYKFKEAKIDREITSAFAKHEKTYLYGLGLKMKALQKADDPVAVDLIKAEIDKVAASADYFPDLMLKANKD